MAFCKSCKYILGDNLKAAYRSNRPQCTHPDNIEKVKRVIWYEKSDGFAYKLGPHKINKQNDCKWYEYMPPPPEPEPELGFGEVP